jgi:predicted RNA-binding protein YlqC (UPF0109 family)
MAMKDLIERIARALVDNPEEVAVTALEGSQATVLELKVAKEDLGKIIGKQGRTARSLRTILGAASAKGRRRVVLEIVE